MNFFPRAGVAALVAIGFLSASRGIAGQWHDHAILSFDVTALDDLGLNVICTDCESTPTEGFVEVVGSPPVFSVEFRDKSIPFDQIYYQASPERVEFRSSALPKWASFEIRDGVDLYDANYALVGVKDVNVVISWGLSYFLQIPEAANESIGTATISFREFATDIDIVDPRPLNDGVAGSIGPDVIVGELHNFNNYGTNGTVSVFSVGTTSCNRGDTPLMWVAENNHHPVIGQAMYRLKNGRIEQIGQSWLKHGFLALAENACSLGCQNPGTGALLGVGCSDPYSANLNGGQGNLGMKSEVNPHTGFFPYPPANPPWSGIVDRRLRAANSDLDPAQNGGGLYFAEGQYVAADDAAAGNNNNNASYRQISITAGPNGTWNMAFAGPTMRERSGIRAWKDNDPDVIETEIQIPNDGLLVVAAKATHLGGGLWHYEYAIQNLNSDRAGQAFSIPLAPGAVLSNIGFHDVDYHSGEPYSGLDWAAVQDASGITWSCEPAAINPNANALRWGTLYNFRFDSHTVPTMTEATIRLFKFGNPDAVTVQTIGPAIGAVDCNGNFLDDRCDLDCNALGFDICTHMGPCGTSIDCDGSGQPDECETDCNGNGVFDTCDLSDGTSADCNTNDVPDECDPNWDNDAMPDDCDPDTDNDGVANAMDVCDFTPMGLPIRTNGTMVGDINNDCDIDLADYSHFDDCSLSSGPNDPPGTLPCLGLYDYDHDGDLDLKDFAGIENAFTGS